MSGKGERRMKLFQAVLEEPISCILGEGPCYDENTGVLSWVDIKTGTLYKKREGKVTLIQTGQYLGAAIPAMSGDYIGVLTTGLYQITENTIRRMYFLKEFQDYQRANDAKCDEQGRIWFGSMPLFPGDMEKGGNLYCYSLESGCRLMLAGTGVSNGMAWSRDVQTMYFIDSCRKQVDALDYEGRKGSICNRRKGFDIPYGVPDGMTIDEEGMLWVAMWGAGCVGRFCPKTGEMLARVMVPEAQVSSCCLGGPEGDHLYITTSGEGSRGSKGGFLYRACVGVRGLPINRFDDRKWKEGEGKRADYLLQNG